MSTTFKELYSRTLTRIEAAMPGKSREGISLLAAKEAINIACKALSRAQMFDELITLNTSNSTVASQATYHIVTDLALTSFKDIISIRYMDDTSSRKLEWVPVRELDEVLPYTLTLGTNSPYWYTRRGMEIELIPVPSEVKSLYIQYEQWPTVLSADADVMSFPDDVSDVLVIAGGLISMAILRGEEYNSLGIVKGVLSGAVAEESRRKDQHWIARPFQASDPVIGEYWKNPLVRRNP